MGLLVGFNTEEISILNDILLDEDLGRNNDLISDIIFPGDIKLEHKILMTSIECLQEPLPMELEKPSNIASELFIEDLKNLTSIVKENNIYGITSQEKLTDRHSSVIKGICTIVGCGKRVRSKGLCKAHGGGRKCIVNGCAKGSQNGSYCIGHGGGKRCNTQGCSKAAQSHGLCKAHGGGARCKKDGCNKSSQGGGFCRSHGGGKRCQAGGCKKGAQRGNYCATHGGFRCCLTVGCVRTDRGGGYCEVHRKDKLCLRRGCKKLSRASGMCTVHIRETRELNGDQGFDEEDDDDVNDVRSSNNSVDICFS